MEEFLSPNILGKSTTILDAATSVDGSPYMILLPIALILFTAKLLSILLKKIKIPEVIGYLLAGLLVGSLKLIPNNPVLSDYSLGGIDILAKIGVVMILFSAGVETDLKAIKSVGLAATIIALAGVIFSVGSGWLLAWIFREYAHMTPGFYTALASKGVNPIYSDIYYGVILGATSVSITVATLKELGKLNGKVGNALISAAILDDVIGVILLSLIISLSGSKEGPETMSFLNGIISACGVDTANLSAGANVGIIIGNMTLFFVLSWLIGFVVKPAFNWLGNKFEGHVRIPIFSLAFCFLWAYLAQAFFDISDITGAYIAGLLLSSTVEKDYIDRRTESTMNLFFVPIFFASVAMKMYDKQGGSADPNATTFIWFGICWIIIGIIGKIAGGHFGARASKFTKRESLIVGVGMMARAEVLIVTAQTGVENGLVDQQIIPYTLGLILISSFLTPIILKLLYSDGKNKKKQKVVEGLNDDDNQVSSIDTNNSAQNVEATPTSIDVKNEPTKN